MIYQKPMRGAQLNRTHPLAKGLVGCWLLNEATGETAFDLSGNGNNGTLENGVAWSGGVLQFDGTDDCVDAGSGSSLDITDAITIEAWIYISSHKTEHVVLSKNYNAYEFSIKNTDEIRLFLSSTQYVITTATNLAEKTWYNVVGTYDSTTGIAKIYVDGREQTATDSASGGITSRPANKVYIGSRAGSAIHFNGSIDSVRIYNRALSAEEVAWSYREPYAMFNPAFNPALLYSAAPPVGAIMNQFQKANIGADLYNGAFA